MFPKISWKQTPLFLWNFCRCFVCPLPLCLLLENLKQEKEEPLQAVPKTSTKKQKALTYFDCKRYSSEICYAYLLNFPIYQEVSIYGHYLENTAATLEGFTICALSNFWYVGYITVTDKNFPWLAKSTWCYSQTSSYCKQKHSQSLGRCHDKHAEHVAVWFQLQVFVI